MRSSVILRTERGSFRILSEIGRGGAAIIYKAETVSADRQVPQVVAIKVLHQHLHRNPEFRQRLTNEFRLMQRLPSRHIPRVYGHGENFIVMELLQGPSLAHLIHGSELLTLEQALDLLFQIAAVIRDLYEHRVLHRDLKPSNLILARERVIKLLDFGIALDLEKEESLQEGFLGSPPYVAPERTGLLETGSNVRDVRSELYAFGVMAFELFTRQLPFDGETVWSILRAHVTNPVPSLGALRADLPDRVVRLIEMCLAKEPYERCQTPQELSNLICEAGEKACLCAPRDSRVFFPIFKSHVIVGRDDPRYDHFPDIDISALDVGLHTSRLHASVFQTGGKWAIQELSHVRNGTWLNGERLSPGMIVPLNHRDEISLANIKLVFSLPEHSDGEKEPKLC